MPDPAEATVVEKRKPAGETHHGTAPGSGAGSSDTRAATRRMTYQTSSESLRAEEIERTRRFLYVVMVLCAVVGPTVLALGGDPSLRLLLVGGCGLLLSVSAGFLLYIRDEARFSQIKSLPLAGIAILTSIIACYYFGFYSPAPMVFTLGIYFYALGSSRLASTIVWATCALLVGGGMVLVSLGAIPDLGLVRANEVTTAQKLVMAAIVQIVLGVTFVFARMSRKATLQAMEGLEQALRQVGQREALLQEVHQDLERALRGGQGRYAGEKVGAWRLSRLIGRGAMGEVYAATHEEQELQAAVKLLAPEVQRDRTQFRRFLREAEVMSQLASPHVVRVHDVGDGSSGMPYIAMELLEGHDLAWHLRKRRRLSSARVVDLVSQVASVLEEARAREIVHRDIKPQNLFLAEKGEERLWKVLDFGVSKLGVEAGTLTRGHVIGTPGYMAPEQARGAPVDHRADVFSLAAIAYRALTGRPAFSGDDYPKVMFDLVYRQPTRPGEHASLPRDVDLALAVGLAKRAADRYATAVELARALAAALAERLADDLRVRAAALLSELPWGTTARDR